MCENGLPQPSDAQAHPLLKQQAQMSESPKMSVGHDRGNNANEVTTLEAQPGSGQSNTLQEQSRQLRQMQQQLMQRQAAQQLQRGKTQHRDRPQVCLVDKMLGYVKNSHSTRHRTVWCSSLNFNVN